MGSFRLTVGGAETAIRLTVGGAESAIAPSDLLKISENPSVFQHFRLTVGGAEIAIAPSDILKIKENPLVFQHFHILGLLGNLWGAPGAYSEPFGASRCSFGALWSLQMLIWSPLEPPEAHLDPFGASRMQLWSLFSQTQSFREPPRANFHHPGAQSVYLGAPDTKRH